MPFGWTGGVDDVGRVAPVVVTVPAVPVLVTPAPVVEVALPPVDVGVVDVGGVFVFGGGGGGSATVLFLSVLVHPTIEAASRRPIPTQRIRAGRYRNPCVIGYIPSPREAESVPPPARGPVVRDRPRRAESHEMRAYTRANPGTQPRLTS
ncbi:hypothetical protein [Fimbriiglobus ruber]|uniref:hypothetical protein n=1 Tax=Fimbriiglobus ruber TaxID=1908690 RepID=UPI000B4B8B75|nr:hypothetical protein [Fimbriiglobus ruber]